MRLSLLTPAFNEAANLPALHARIVATMDQLGIDCRYCHNGVEKSWFSNIPAASTCMNCHTQVKKDSPRLEPLRQSAATGKPVQWVQIHRLPDYVYFNHSAHLAAGVSCVSCPSPSTAGS